MRLTTFAVPTFTAAALGLWACGGDDVKLTEKTLKYTEKETQKFGFADNPPKTKIGRNGPEKVSNGDLLTFRSEMLDASKKDVGDLDATCTFTDATSGSFEKSHAQCLGTFTLPDGTLTASVGGAAFGTKVTRGSVIGGTGAYSGATGDFTSTEGGEGRPSRDVFHIFVPKR
jgi:hypothetical protein